MVAPNRCFQVFETNRALVGLFRHFLSENRNPCYCQLGVGIEAPGRANAGDKEDTRPQYQQRTVDLASYSAMEKLSQALEIAQNGDGDCACCEGRGKVISGKNTTSTLNHL